MSVVLFVPIPPCFFELLRLPAVYLCGRGLSPSLSFWLPAFSAHLPFIILVSPSLSLVSLPPPRPFSSFLFSCIFTLFSSSEFLWPNSPHALPSHCEFSWNFSPELSVCGVMCFVCLNPHFCVKTLNTEIFILPMCLLHFGAKTACAFSVHQWQCHIANSLIITAQGTLLSSPLYLFVISHNMQSICWLIMLIISEHFVTPKNINISSSFKSLHKRLSVSHQGLIFLPRSWWRRMKISKTVHWTSFLCLSWFHCKIK